MCILAYSDCMYFNSLGAPAIEVELESPTSCVDLSTVCTEPTKREILRQLWCVCACVWLHSVSISSSSSLAGFVLVAQMVVRVAVRGFHFVAR